MEARLFALQRLTALLLAPLVLVHLALILYAVRGGLTADEILGRTQGSWGWGAFYALFVLAAAIHGPIGLRNVLVEWGRVPRRVANPAMAALAVVLALLGFRAVYAVVA